jgi:hypothetical protein
MGLMIAIFGIVINSSIDDKLSFKFIQFIFYKRNVNLKWIRTDFQKQLLRL